MDRLRTRPPVPLGADLLYRLSLQVGTSLEVRANCSSFLRALLEHLEADYAAVWLRGRYLGQGRRPDGYFLVHALPEGPAAATQIPPDHALLDRLGERRFLSVAAPDPAYADCRTEQDLPNGTMTVLRLGRLGFLKLHDADQAPYVASALAPLRPVFDRFAASLEHGVAYRQALDDLDERSRLRNRLRMTVDRLSVVLGSLQTGVLVESDDLEVTLANQAFCDLISLDEPPEALIGLRRTHLIRRIRPCLADPDASLVRLGHIARDREAVVGERIALADGAVLLLDYTPLDEAGYRAHVWQYHRVEAPPARRPEPGDGQAEGEAEVAGAPEPFQPTDLVRSVIEAVRERASAAGLALEVFVSDVLASMLVADAATLRQVLTFLTDNAVRHTEQGHVALTAVPVGRRQERVIVQFSVADTGRGIPRADLEHFFDAARHPHMARARRRIEALGGDLSVQSVKGRGSVFTVVLPCYLPETEPS